jgi:hypothetical protein
MSTQDFAFVSGTVLAILIALPVFREQSWRFVETWIGRIQNAFLSPEQSKDDGPVVSALYIYPVKSLRRVSLSIANVDKLGLVGDRRFMLVVPAPPPAYGCLPTDPTYNFITQRQCPILATISAEIEGDCLKLWCGTESVQVSIPSRLDIATLVFKARIWSDVVTVRDLGDEAAAFVQNIIGTDDVGKGIRLVTMAGTRPTDDKYLPPAARTLTGGTPLTALNDGFPVLVACEASLAEVNRRLTAKGKDEIPMSRFRPNIVIKGSQPFEEDTWKLIQIGDTILHLVKECPRCKQSCTDQETGKVSDEPVATLGEFRALGKVPGDVYFAQNAVIYGKSLSVGTAIKVMKRGDPVWE